MTSADLADTPYNFVRREGAAIVLQYGDHYFERWIPAKVKSPACDVYRIRFRRRWYRFGGRVAKGAKQ
jgi:hypothetical protein